MMRMVTMRDNRQAVARDKKDGEVFSLGQSVTTLAPHPADGITMQPTPIERMAALLAVHAPPRRQTANMTY
jgi:hypothetical protein